MDTVSLPVTGGTEDSYVFRQLSPAGKRLFWTLQGPLECAIQVAPSQWHEEGAVMEPYFRPAASDGDSAAAWHPVSQESLMEPRVTATTVRVRCFNDWELLWADLHQDCPDKDEDHHSRRPRAGDTQLEVTASGDFLTVHDYVSALHPWLMAMREKLLEVLGKLDGKTSWPPETRLAVLGLGPGPLIIDREERWASWHRRPRTAPHST